MPSSDSIDIFIQAHKTRGINCVLGFFGAPVTLGAVPQCDLSMFTASPLQYTGTRINRTSFPAHAILGSVLGAAWKRKCDYAVGGAAGTLGAPEKAKGKGYGYHPDRTISPC